MPEQKKLYHGYLAAFATLLMWSGFSLISRLGGKSILTPYDIFALRLATASLVLLPFIGSMPKIAWRDGKLWFLAIIGNLLYCLLVYQGFKSAPAAHGAILLAGMQPFLISIIVWLIARTRPNRLRGFGLALIGGGIVCAAMPYFTVWSADSAYGDFLIILSSISWALYSVLSARWGYSAWTLTRAVALGSAILYLPVYVLWLPKQLAAAPLSMIITQSLFQGVVATILAMLTYLKAVSILGTERSAAFLSLVPIVTGLAAVPLLGEALSGWLLCGLFFVSLGAYIASRYGGAVFKR